jgi:hypothetical protein
MGLAQRAASIMFLIRARPGGAGRTCCCARLFPGAAGAAAIPVGGKPLAAWAEEDILHVL